MDPHLPAIVDLIHGVTVATEPMSSAQIVSAESSVFPYVLVAVDGGRRSSQRYTVAPHHADYTVSTVAIGLSVRQVSDARARVVNSLALARPDVDGRVVSRVEHAASLPPMRDSDVPDRVIYVASDNWTFWSDAAL